MASGPGRRPCFFWGHPRMRGAWQCQEFRPTLPAFVASRVLSRPLVSTTVDHFGAAFGIPSQPILAEYDTRTDEALARLASTLTTTVTQNLVAQFDEVLAERDILWRDVASGIDDAMRDLPTPSQRHPRGITPDGDDEHLLARKRVKILGLITACLDTSIQAGLLQMHEGERSCGVSNLASRRLTTLGRGESIPTTGPSWSLRSTLARSPLERVPFAARHSLAPWTGTAQRHLLCLGRGHSRPQCGHCLHPRCRSVHGPCRRDRSLLALTSDSPTFSPPPLAMRTPPWTCRSAHRTPSRPAQTTPDPGLLPISTAMACTFPPSSDRRSPTPASFGAPMGNITWTH